MTFRDDHDATLARAEALQRELDETKRKLAEAETGSAPPAPAPPAPPPMRESETRGEIITGIVIGVLGLVAVGFMIYESCR